MEFRQLGNSGLKVSSLTLGTMTFGGGGAFAKASLRRLRTDRIDLYQVYEWDGPAAARFSAADLTLHALYLES